jgi:hypothetical protein
MFLLRGYRYRTYPTDAESQDLAAALPGLKLLHPWLCDVPNQILQQALIDSDKAFQRFFRKEAGYPD